MKKIKNFFLFFRDLFISISEFEIRRHDELAKTYKEAETKEEKDTATAKFMASNNTRSL